MSGRVLFDTCTLENFAAVDRLDLLRDVYADRCAWTAGVEWEVRRGLAERPRLQQVVGATWLGPPIAAAEDPLAMQQVDQIRRALGGSVRLPTQHLGEAQTIYYANVVEPSATVATDDRAAFDLARRRGLRVVDTSGILHDCHGAGMVGCPEAYELLHKMAAAGQGVTIPPSHWYVCPPES